MPRPLSLVVGVGARKGAPTDEVLTLIEGSLAEARLSPRSVCALATVDTKAQEPGIVAAAAFLGVGLRTYTAETLSRIEVPNPSPAPFGAVGMPSVAEAAALAAAGPDAELVVSKRKSAPAGRAPMATCAIARIRDLPRPDTGVLLESDPAAEPVRPTRPARPAPPAPPPGPTNRVRRENHQYRGERVTGPPEPPVAGATSAALARGRGRRPGVSHTAGRPLGRRPQILNLLKHGLRKALGTAGAPRAAKDRAGVEPALSYRTHRTHH